MMNFYLDEFEEHLITLKIKLPKLMFLYRLPKGESIYSVSVNKGLTWHKADVESNSSSMSLVCAVKEQGRQQAALDTNSLR